jgi:predicted RecB family nuclease
METSSITATIFRAYLKCPTKGLLITRGEQPPLTFFGDLQNDISAAYKAKFSRDGLVDFRDLAKSPLRKGTTTLIDCDTTFYSAGPARTTREGAAKARSADEYVPTLYSAWNKPDESDRLTICFAALAVGQATGAGLPRSGKVIFGDAGRTKQVDVRELVKKVERTIEQIIKERESHELRAVVLNKHCQICDFQTRCRGVAGNHEDLSLLGRMTEKERLKFIEKGITTITQLSYGYRPRRRRRSKLTPPSRVSPIFKYDQKLKAVAIKKGQVHVVGAPEFGVDGTPVFIDVEGVPGRDFYYLIGLRYQDQGGVVERSFWADRAEDELKIWQDCVSVLREVDNPRLIHYGAYESRFLKNMKARWASTVDAAFIDRLVEGSTNLVSTIYGKIYFPVYSNSLKEIARWLGFEWTWRQASGSAAIVLRRHWELTGKDPLRRELLIYNKEDCRATELVADAVKHICGHDGGQARFEVVNVKSLEPKFQRTFGKFAGALPEFEKINTAAYWDYQRSKIYVRTDKTVRRSVRKSENAAKRVAVEKEVIVDDRPKLCPSCGASKVWIAVRMADVKFDLKFTRRGIKRWALRYRYNEYRCPTCKAHMTPYAGDRPAGRRGRYKRRSSKYGPNLRSYIAYLLLELRLSHERARDHVATVFDVTVPKPMVNEIKRAVAKQYEPTYRSILDQIVAGPVVHADETKGVVYGGGHYVWIFANLTSVAYVYSASREASKLIEILSGFRGVLVSDFYTAYDSLPCAQQKCLIHLMRDINEDLIRHPFNEELTFVAQRFGALLRVIVEAIDQHGLKKFYLQKYKRSAQQFLSEIASLDCSTEVGGALKKRIDKNKDKLFTFLDHDGVPWNNNNAEHAVRAFTRLRNGMSTSTPKGTSEYCILLSLQQTLRYRGIGFLEFPRSGRMEL